MSNSVNNLIGNLGNITLVGVVMLAGLTWSVTLIG
jgi:branched-subunit amino acid permease